MNMRSPEYWMQPVKPVRYNPMARLYALVGVGITSAADYIERQPQWFALYFVLVAVAMWWLATHDAPSWVVFGQLAAAVLTLVLWQLGLLLVMAVVITGPVHVILFGTRLREARTYDPERAKEWWTVPRGTPPTQDAPPRHVRWRA